MLQTWVQIGGGALLILVLGTLLKCVADIGQIKGAVGTLAARVDGVDTDLRELRTEMNGLRTEMNGRFREMNDRFLRIENILLGRPPGADIPTDGG